MKKKDFNFKVTKILKNPRSEWKEFVAFSRGRNIRTAFRDLDVDWKKYNTKDYLFTHDTIVCSVETEDNGYWITKPCEELVNANGNAWTNKVLLNSFRTFIGGENFLEHCFVEGTRVLMSDGTYKNIEEIVIGDKIINAKGEVDTVVNTMNRLYSGKMVEISDKNILSKKIVCTSNHPFYVYQDKCVSAISQKQIKPQNKKSRLHYDDFGFAPGEHPTQNEKIVSRWGEPQYIESQYLDNAKTALIHPVPLNVVECDEINENRAFLIGWFLAEGSYTTAGGIQFSLSDKEIDVAEKIVSLLEIEFPEKNMMGSFNSKDLKSFAEKAPVKTAQIRKYNNPKTGNPSYLTVLYCSKIAAAFFRKWCNEYSWAKCLPEEAMFLPLELQKTILIEYINSDGCKRRKSRGASVDSKSKKLIQQMRFIAIRLGTFPLYRETGVLKRYSIESIREGYPVFIEPNTGKLSRPGYSLCFSCEDWYKLYGGEKPKHSSHSVKFGNNFVFRFNKKQEFETTGTAVFNIETQNDHSYIVEGVAVHNCQIQSLSKGKILDAIIRPVVHTNKYGSANIYFCDILVATNRKHYDLVRRIESGQLNTLSMGACHVDGTQITMYNGLQKNVEDVKIGDKVITGTNKVGIVTNTSRRICSKGELLKISTRYGDTYVTEEHPYLVFNGYDICAGCGKELTATTRSCVSDSNLHKWCSKTCFQKHCNSMVSKENHDELFEQNISMKWIEAGNLKKGNWILVPVIETESQKQLDKNYARLLGYYLSEGNLHYYNGTPCAVEINFNINEKNYIDEVVFCAKNLGIEPYVQERKEKSITRIVLRSKELSKWMFDNGGILSYSKKISDSIFEYGKETFLNILGAYINGDGCGKQERLSFCTVSKDMAEQLFLMTKMCGVPCTLQKAIKHRVHERDLYTINICNGYASSFIGYSDKANHLETKQENKKINGYRLVKIHSIDRIDLSVPVNNLTVEGEHTYLANGFVVHNCANVTQCSICGKVFKDEDEEVCEHLKHHIGGYCKCSDGKSRICAEFVGACDENGEYIPDSCQFIEASWVEHPAFKGAVVNSFVETEEERQLREGSKDELTKLFEESLFERLKVADTPTSIALKITKACAKADRYLKIAKKISKKETK